VSNVWMGPLEFWDAWAMAGRPSLVLKREPNNKKDETWDTRKQLMRDGSKSTHGDSSS
jgi:hypothetical protein